MGREDLVEVDLRGQGYPIQRTAGEELWVQREEIPEPIRKTSNTRGNGGGEIRLFERAWADSFRENRKRNTFEGKKPTWDPEREKGNN